MYKKIISFILSVSLLLILFSANLCSAADCDHSTLDSWQIDIMPTSAKSGQISRKCAICNEVRDTMVLPFSRVANKTSSDFNKKDGIDNFDINVIKHLNNKEKRQSTDDVYEIIADVNSDGTSNLKDLVRAKKISIGYYSSENNLNINLDFDRNFDGKSDALDLVFIHDYVLYFKFIYTPPTNSGGGITLPIFPW